MASPLIRKLECFHPLSEADKRVLDAASTDIRTFGPREDIIVEGDKPSHVHLMIEG
ncbi:hypothetical protein [Salinarimonas soli]|uniref:hypothetical protein n=1 Tax=Salinarimonas soli TaxID=1638099 RepID=UPI0027B936E7|nr:hypothetical protein [Salinarimonas soli]